MKTSKLEKGSGNTFLDLGIDEFEAKELHLRTSLMNRLNAYIQENKLTQTEAAEMFDISQPRVSNLKSGRVDLFSTGMLLSMLEHAGFQIFEQLEERLEAA